MIPAERSATPTERSATRWAVLLALATSLACAAIALGPLSAFPNSADEANYVWISERLLEGRLSVPAQSLPEPVAFMWRTVKDGRELAKYPPSFPALLVPFTALGVPWLANPVLAGLCVLVAFRVARVAYEDAWLALGAAALLATNAMFLASGASFFPQTACVLLGLLAWDGLQRSLAASPQGALPWAALAGLAAGFLASIRPPDAVAFLWLAVPAWLVASRAPRARPLAAFALCAALGLLPLLLHNRWATGEWLRSSYDLFAADTGEYRIHWGAIGRNLPLLADYRRDFRGWAIDPAWLVPLAVLAGLRPAGVRTRVADAVLLGLLPPLALTVLTFPETALEANRYGPRYAAPLLLAMAALGARVVLGSLRRPALAAGGLVLLCALQGIQLREGLAFHAARIRERTCLYRAVDQAAVRDAVIFLRGETGGMPPKDLTRNDVELANPVLYAVDAGPARNAAALRQLFRGRRALLWEYAGPPGRGTLSVLDGASAEATGERLRVEDGRLLDPVPAAPASR